MKRVAIFASGSGSNAENIIRYFSNHSDVEISIVLTNNPKAYVIDRCATLGVPCKHFSKKQFTHDHDILNLLLELHIDVVVLAGFLWLVPAHILRAFPNRVVNIHPALLPGYGGKGMYGDKVHQAVLAAGEQESGITVHYVNEHYDKGTIIIQAHCPVKNDDDHHALAQRIHALEYLYFPVALQQVLDTI